MKLLEFKKVHPFVIIEEHVCIWINEKGVYLIEPPKPEYLDDKFRICLVRTICKIKHRSKLK